MNLANLGSKNDMNAKPSFLAKFITNVRKRHSSFHQQHSHSGIYTLGFDIADNSVVTSEDFPSMDSEIGHSGVLTINTGSFLDQLSLPSAGSSPGHSPGPPPSSSSGSSFFGSDTTEYWDVDSTNSRDVRLPVLSLTDEMSSAVLDKRRRSHGSLVWEGSGTSGERRVKTARHRNAALVCSRETKDKNRKQDRMSPDFSSVRKGTIVGTHGATALRDEALDSMDTVYSDARKFRQVKSTFIKPKSNECLLTIAAHKSPVTQVVVIAGYVMTASTDSTLKVWKRSDGELVKSITCHKPVRSFTLLRVDNRKYVLLAGCSMGEVELYRMKFGRSVHVKFIKKCTFHVPNPVTLLTISPDRFHLASASCFPVYLIENRTLESSARGNLKLWSVKDIIRAVQEPDCEINHRIMRTAREIIASATGNKMVVTAAGTCAGNINRQVQDFGITSLLFTPDSTMLILGFGFPEDSSEQYKKVIMVCSVDSMEPLYIHPHMSYPTVAVAAGLMSVTRGCYGEAEGVTCAVFLQTSRNVSRMKLFKKHMQAKLEIEWQTKAQSVQCGMALSPDKLLVASAHVPLDTRPLVEGQPSVQTVQLTFYDSASGEQVMNYDTGQTERVTDLCYSVDGAVICTVCEDGSVKIWDCPLPQLQEEMEEDIFDMQEKMKNQAGGLSAGIENWKFSGPFKPAMRSKFESAGEKVAGYGKLLKVFSQVRRTHSSGVGSSPDVNKKDGQLPELVRSSTCPDVSKLPAEQPSRNLRRAVLDSNSLRLTTKSSSLGSVKPGES